MTQAIQGVPGVRSVEVSLDAHQARVRWSGASQPEVDAVIRAVEEAGYGATGSEGASVTGTENRMGGWRLNVWLGVPVTVTLTIGEWGLGLGMTSWFQWLAFGLATLVQFIAGARYYRGAWSQLKVGGSNMDTLVALGSTTAFAYSTWALVSQHGGHVYFMEAAAIITLISAGHWLESRVSLRASGALRKLLTLAPAMARRRNADGPRWLSLQLSSAADRSVATCR